MRAEVESAPLILMVSIISHNDTPQKVLEGGADDFLIKLYLSTDVVRVLSDGLLLLNQAPLLRTNFLTAAVRRYSFRIIQPSIKRIPTTKRSRGVASIIPSDVVN